MPYYSDERELSRFNEGIYQIKRLDEDWQKCKEYRETGNLEKWKWKLDTVYLELAYDAKKIDEKDKTKYVETLKQLDTDILQAQMMKNKPVGRAIFYLKLKEKEAILREVQQASGKGGKYAPADEDDFD